MEMISLCAIVEKLTFLNQKLPFLYLFVIFLYK